MTAVMSGVLVVSVLAGIGWYLMSWTAPMPTESETAMEGMEMNGEGLAQAAVMVSPARRQLIGVKTETVKEQALETTIRTVGSVDYDERRVRQVNLRVSGWITDLFVDYTGKSVEQGAPLLALYSPDLVASQEE
jgi:hypothetical protein